MNFLKKGISLFLCSILCLLPLSVPVYSEETATESELQQILEVDPERLTAEQAFSLIQVVASHLSLYGRYEDISDGSLYQAAVDRLISENPALYHMVLKAMLESLDEHSEYYTAEEAVSLRESVTGEITTGIGVVVDFSNDANAVISSVILGTPADRAGLQVGDILFRADGVSLTGMNSETILSHIRGEAGSTLHLEVERNGAVLSFELVREPIIGTSVTTKVYEENENKALYICLYGFVSNTAEKFNEALAEAEQAGITNLIIDLRDNGGGILSQAIQMADCFVPEGKLITTEDHKITLLNKTYVGSSGEKKKYNTVLLVNEYTASASEVFAAALQQNGLATVIGTQTYGKGTIQSINDLQTGGMIKYTSGYYLTPSGNNINGIGLSPDIMIENSYRKPNPDDFGKFQYSQVYRVGDTGSEIYLAKELLTLYGLYQGELNEDYDQDLYYAVYAFQQQTKLFPYGVLDLTTQLQLRNYLGIVQLKQDDQLAEALAQFHLTLPAENEV